jgi:hypothetical protein
MKSEEPLIAAYLNGTAIRALARQYRVKEGTVHAYALTAPAFNAWRPNLQDGHSTDLGISVRLFADEGLSTGRQL